MVQQVDITYWQVGLDKEYTRGNTSTLVISNNSSQGYDYKDLEIKLKLPLV
jgi:hypothetical protein